MDEGTSAFREKGSAFRDEGSAFRGVWNIGMATKSFPLKNRRFGNRNLRCDLKGAEIREAYIQGIQGAIGITL